MSDIQNNIQKELERRAKLLQLGQIIQEALEEKGLSQNRLAQQVGYSTTYTNNVIRGNDEPADDWLERVAQVLLLDADELFRLIGRVPRRIRNGLNDETIQEIVAVLLDATDEQKKKALDAVKKIVQGKG